MKEKLRSLVFLMTFFSYSLLADNFTVSGLVTGDGEPLIGATISVMGTSTGTITDFDGKFELSVPDDATTLLFSYTGFSSKEVPINRQTYFEVELITSNVLLGEVVVTSLGIKREKKALGYAVQDIDASELAEARSSNVVNGLSGRVAGIQVTGAAVPGGGLR